MTHILLGIVSVPVLIIGWSKGQSREEEDDSEDEEYDDDLERFSNHRNIGSFCVWAAIVVSALGPLIPVLGSHALSDARLPRDGLVDIGPLCSVDRHRVLVSSILSGRLAYSLVVAFISHDCISSSA